MKSPYQAAQELNSRRAPAVPQPWHKPTIKYDDDKHRYWINGVEVASVTQILDATYPKPALTWWGMRVGFGAVVHLLQENIISFPNLMNAVYDELLTGVPVNGPHIWRGQGQNRKKKTEIEGLAINAKLDTNNIRDTAGDQGTLIHDALTIVALEDQVPEILDFEPAQRGYIQAFCRWYVDQEPEFHRTEVIVGNGQYSYAGRFDIEVKDKIDPDRLCLYDYKTSKGVYPNHFDQLDLYEAAEMAVGAERYARTGIIHLRPDGNYQVFNNWHEDHKAALAAVDTYWAREHDKNTMPKGLL